MNFLLAILIDLAIGFGFTGMLAKSKRQDYLTYGSKQPWSFKPLDSHVKRLTGQPNDKQRKMADRTVKYTRLFVNTKSFEHLVLAYLNKNSPLMRTARKVRLFV